MNGDPDRNGSPRGALACLDRLSVPIASVWLPCGWGAWSEQASLRERLLSPRFRRLIARRLADARPGVRARAETAVTERLAMRAAFARWTELTVEHARAGAEEWGDESVRENTAGEAEMRRWAVSESHPAAGSRAGLYLRHTVLGGPELRWRGEIAAWASARGIRARDVHISFSHDGGSLVTALAGAPGLRGMGVDLIHLPRLRTSTKDRGHLLRLAARFMCEEELDAFRAESAEEDLESVRLRIAAHFCLMEAAAKALGAGLKIGGGYSRHASLPRRSISVLTLRPVVRFSLGPDAHQRCCAVGASHLEGAWSFDDGFVASIALLRRSESRRPEAGRPRLQGSPGPMLTVPVSPAADSVTARGAS